MLPLISVLTIARDEGRYVAACIASVRAQSSSEWEHVLVSDGSTDDTARIAREAGDERLRVIELAEPVGRGRARNVAVEAARGGYFAILDADDICLPDRLERQGDRLSAEPSVLVLGGQYRMFEDADGTVGPPSQLPTRPEDLERLMRSGRMPVAHGASTLRREFFDRYGLYDERCLRSQDFELMLRCAGDGVLAATDDVAILWRQYQGSNLTERSRRRKREWHLYALRVSRARREGSDPGDFESYRRSTAIVSDAARLAARRAIHR